jgi:tRNA-specific 2-thiouridylase
VTDQAIGIAMSGGVDSTACALILGAKYKVHGFFMNLGQPNYSEQERRVKEVAGRLGIDLSVIDLRPQFERLVLDYFSGSYFAGKTPNPCVICNREIKFGLFLDTILARGMTKMATGHYAKVVCSEGSCHLYCGADPKKDQSYFLSRLSQAQLGRVLFPLGQSTKESTYALVEQHGFLDFRGIESQDVCFLENNQVSSFLQNRLEGSDAGGPILSTSGEQLGEHTGLFRYTIGQRRGLGISSSAPLYVIRLDRENNAVIVGSDSELFENEARLDGFHWLAGSPPDTSSTFTVRIRYTHKGARGRLELEGDTGRVIFLERQRAVTPGQFAVFYRDRELLGSAVIL